MEDRCKHNVPNNIPCFDCDEEPREYTPARPNAEAVPCSAVLGELEAALSILDRLRHMPPMNWGDRTNYEFLEDVMLDLSDIIDSERCHSPNDVESSDSRP